MSSELLTFPTEKASETLHLLLTITVWFAGMLCLLSAVFYVDGKLPHVYFQAWGVISLIGFMFLAMEEK